MRADKLERQLRSQSKRSKRQAKDTHARLRQEVGELDRRIGLQLNALERGVEPELVGERIAALRVEKEQAEAALKELAPEAAKRDGEELAAALERIPDLSSALRDLLQR